ncbi:hypothetical protein ACJ2_41090 [Pantoea sp. QMID2]|nr:hypothetical protein ACJ3_40760 [Pantoea sp. QMID3]GME46569.1 hypothetical protein ACJ1_40520 [Pantoea sp. QMID1]GME61550.1 hypothetical protein ACJ4_40320 [Pantoea sp. QMID4]GME63206.1 hypothetical protein ACJ2_41090 [Pantoea sp. QMID2]
MHSTITINYIFGGIIYSRLTQALIMSLADVKKPSSYAEHLVGFFRGLGKDILTFEEKGVSGYTLVLLYSFVR